MKKAWIYLSVTAFEMALGLVYGFWLQRLLPVAVWLAVAFLVPFAVFGLRSQTRDSAARWVEVIAVSVLFAAVSPLTFSLGNRIGSTFVGEHDVVVEYVIGRGGGTATFTMPNGRVGEVELHDYRPVLSDDANFVDVGDTIRVREYRGLFQLTYYTFVEETEVPAE